MSQLVPLPITRIEGNASPASPSPFPVLGNAQEGAAGAEPAAVAGNPEARRMAQMERMLQEAQGRAESVEREAYDKAYAAGEKAGLALGEKRAEQILEAMQRSLKQAQSECLKMRQSCVDAVVDIAQSITEQLVGRLVDEDRQALLNAAKRAADLLPRTGELRLAVHPDDRASFERLLGEEEMNWRLHTDAHVEPGTCRIVSKDQDAMIDPVRAVADAVQQIRVTLHVGSLDSGGDVEPEAPATDAS